MLPLGCEPTTFRLTNVYLKGCHRVTSSFAVVRTESEGDPFILLATANLSLYFQAQLVRLLSHWPATNSTQFRNEYYRVAALPDLVRTDLESLKCSGQSDPKENSGDQILERHYSVLKSICANHCLGIVEAYNLVKLEFNSAKVKTLDMKLAYLRQDVLAQTYTPQVTEMSCP